MDVNNIHTLTPDDIAYVVIVMNPKFATQYEGAHLNFQNLSDEDNIIAKNYIIFRTEENEVVAMCEKIVE